MQDNYHVLMEIYVKVIIHEFLLGTVLNFSIEIFCVDFMTILTAKRHEHLYTDFLVIIKGNYVAVS